MSQLAQACFRHPDRETRVRCSSCGRPICPKCMRESAVGMKCPECARQPRRASNPATTRTYAVAAVSGVAASTVIGLLLIIGRIGFFGLLIPALAGLLVGEVVSRNARRLGGTVFQTIAAVSTAVGIVLGARLVGIPPAAVLRGPPLVGIIIASIVAAVRVGR